MPGPGDWIEDWKSDEAERTAAQDVYGAVRQTTGGIDHDIQQEDVAGAVVVFIDDDGQIEISSAAVESVREQAMKIGRLTWHLLRHPADMMARLFIESEDFRDKFIQRHAELYKQVSETHRDDS